MNGYGDIYTDAELARNYRMDAHPPAGSPSVKGTGAAYALLRRGRGSPTACDTWRAGR